MSIISSFPTATKSSSSVSYIWGDEPTQTENSLDGIGDETWWNDLRDWAISATPTERAACIGKTKRMPLGDTYLGSTHLIMRCIAADQDGLGTLTFHPVATLAENSIFGDSAIWTSSTVRDICQIIATTCAAKNVIKIVKKGTCAEINSNRNGTPIYNNETIFLLSEREYGLDTYSPISTANSTESKAECTLGYNAPYSYFDGNGKRIMYRGDAYGNPTTNYAYQWERSRSSDNSNRVCCVVSSGSANYGYYSSSRLYLAPSFVIGTNDPFTWTNGQESDSIWWYTLHQYIQSHTASELQASDSPIQVGKTVKAPFTSSPVLDFDKNHLLVVIGINIDGDKTVTFQTKNGSPTYISAFGSDAKWIGSTARSHCQTYYNAMPTIMKNNVVTVSKGTNTEYNTSSVVYNDETVFLPSIYEMGLDSYSHKPVGAEYTQGKSTAYPLYVDNNSRIKLKGDSGSADWYWTRSRSSNYSSDVCRVGGSGSANGYGCSGSNLCLAPAYVYG